MDIVATFTTNSAVAVYLNNAGNGTFRTSLVASAVTDATSVAVADFDGDSDMDFVVTQRSTNTIRVYINNGAASFTSNILSTTAAGAFDVATADVDNDGDYDIVSTQRDGDSVILWRNNGRGVFTSTSVASVTSPRGVVIRVSRVRVLPWHWLTWCSRPLSWCSRPLSRRMSTGTRGLTLLSSPTLTPPPTCEFRSITCCCCPRGRRGTCHAHPRLSRSLSSLMFG